MAWPRALCAGTSNNPRTASSARLGRIQSPEILEHEPSLLRRKPGQLFPRGIAQPGTRAGRAGLEQRREVHAVAGGGATGALFVFVGLTPREGPAGVEQPAVQPLLTLDRLLVETARVQLARQLARLLRQRARRGASALGLQPLELLRERPLARRDRAQLREHRLTARAHHGQQPARLAVQPLLVARHAGELLDRFREPAPRLRARDLAAAPREGERRGVERVHGLFRQRPGLSGVRLSLLQLLARRGHLALRKAERALELRRDERVLPRRLADLPLHRRRPLLDRRLARPRPGTALSAAQRFGHLLLAVGERRRLRQRAVERAERLLAPRAGERVAPRPQRLGEPRQLLLRGLPGPLGAGLVGLPGGLGGPLHRGLRLPRGLVRRRERRLPPGRRPELLPHLLDAVRQRVRPLFERALPRRRRAVRAPRIRRVPFGLAPLQVFRVGGERSQRTLRCSACRVASGSSWASASCNSRSRCSSSGVTARCNSCCTSRSRCWNAESLIPAACAARAISSTALDSSCTRCSSASCSRATACARSVAWNGNVPAWDEGGGRRPPVVSSRERCCARSPVRSPRSRCEPAIESAVSTRPRVAARIAARSSSRLGSRRATSALRPRCGAGALSHASTRNRNVSPGSRPRRAASSSPCTMARSPTPLTSSDSRAASPTLPVRLTRQLTTWRRDNPWSSRTSITRGWRSDSGRVVSRPGTGTVTTGAESGTTRNANCGASSSRAPPSAVATSRRQMPEAAGARRPEKRAPVTASRAMAPP